MVSELFCCECGDPVESVVLGRPTSPGARYPRCEECAAEVLLKMVFGRNAQRRTDRADEGTRFGNQVAVPLDTVRDAVRKHCSCKGLEGQACEACLVLREVCGGYRNG